MTILPWEEDGVIMTANISERLYGQKQEYLKIINGTNLNALKTDVNIYTKWEHSLNKHLELYADVQYRKVHYTMNGFRE
ncbi:MAG: hypothetical protein WKG06_42030 [Segetibacter sp.]